MLDSDTKRRIETARDILVGKVPDPKSQVEQITIALIYKFMDDMDAESEELGGKRKFFTGAFARYGWAKLMRSGLGGHETLALYGEGITKMTENPGLPPLSNRPTPGCARATWPGDALAGLAAGGRGPTLAVDSCRGPTGGVPRYGVHRRPALIGADNSPEVSPISGEGVFAGLHGWFSRCFITVDCVCPAKVGERVADGGFAL